MRITKYILSIIFVLGIMSSCQDTLELTPRQSLATSEALGDVEGMRTALNGAYNALQAVGYYGRNYMVIPEIEADLVYLSIANSNRFVQEYTYQFNTQAGNFTAIWNTAYTTILRVNNVINGIDALEGDADEKNQVKGEALAIRALCHFDLVRFFAEQPTAGNPSSDLGVPIVLEAKIDEPPRDNVAAVYDQIISDLNEAKGLLNDEGIYNWSPLAMDALLARVHLYRGNYSQAAASANAVINSGQFALESDVEAMFAAPGSSEEIFTLLVQADESNGSDNHGGIYLPEIYGDIRVAADLLTKYEEGDTRLAWYYVFTNGEVYHSKYLGQDGIVGLVSPKILRLSEMYLILAEANLQQGDSAGALTALNTLRTVRSASELTDVNLQTILDERHRELAFEGHTLFDYWRTNTDVVRDQCNTGLELNVNDCTIPASSTLSIHPIPQREIDVNQSMVQNPGY